MPAPEGRSRVGSSHEASLRRPGLAGDATDSRDLVPQTLQASRLSGFRSIMAAPRLLELSAFIASGPHAGSGGGLGREVIDPAQDLGEQRPRHRDLGQLEHNVAAVAHDPGADLDELRAQGRE